MPRLKQQGRRLCVSSRKLVVCGCGGTTTDNNPCCLASRPCRVLNTNTFCKIKVWFDYTHAGRMEATGGGPKPYDCGSTVNISSQGSGIVPVVPPSVSTANCVVQSTVDSATASSASAPAGNFTSGSRASASASNIQAILNSASESSNRWSCRLGFGVSLSPSSGDPFADISGGSISVSWQNGSLTASVDAPSTGTATASLIKQGSCVVGVRVDFNASAARQCRQGVSPNTTTVDYQSTFAGSIAAVLCGCISGCGSTEDLCSTTTMPGATDPPPSAQACAYILRDGYGANVPANPPPSSPLPLVEPTDNPLDMGAFHLP